MGILVKKVFSSYIVLNINKLDSNIVAEKKYFSYVLLYNKP